VAALCAAHPGPAPVLVEWMEGEGNGASVHPGLAPGVSARLRSRTLRVEVADDLLAALRELVGPDNVHLVRMT
jgi:hypothetical protein